MHRTDRFLISHRLYAVDLTSLTGHRTPTPQGHNEYYFDGRIDAVWYRRRRGVTVACIGQLWDLQYPEPADGRAFLEQHTDGRHGGTCHGRWDGDSYWGTGTLTDQEEHLAILRPMLDQFPTVPAGYDGWWRF
jgi:hypothetical protein